MRYQIFHDFLFQRLLGKEIDDVTLGLLLGYQSESTVHILNVCRSNVRDNEELMINIAEVEQLSPAGMVNCTMYDVKTEK